MTMSDPKEIARDYAMKWLNSKGDPLPDDYITDVVVMFDSGEDVFDERMMLLELVSDDDGGNAMMFCHISADHEVVWAAWYFDTTWGEMT